MGIGYWVGGVSGVVGYWVLGRVLSVKWGFGFRVLGLGFWV